MSSLDGDEQREKEMQDLLDNNRQLVTDLRQGIESIVYLKWASIYISVLASAMLIKIIWY